MFIYTCTYTKELKSVFGSGICSFVFTVALFTKAQKQKQPEKPSAGE
jgi:hypothetical protein